jgi:hypothetical protein
MAQRQSKAGSGNGGNHVEVSVVNGVISVKPDSLPVTDHNVVVEWEIVNSDGWTFPKWEDGIKLNRHHGDFSNGASDGSGKLYTMRDKNSEKRTHKYTVRVTNGGPPLSLDPDIKNEG